MFHVEQLDKAVQYLQSGGVLAYPSESVWGLGCDAFCEQAVREILRIKNRPEEKGVIVLANHADVLKPLLADLPDDEQQQLIARAADNVVRHDGQAVQAKTWLVPVAAAAGIPSWLTGQFDSLAVRITPHPILQKLCEGLKSAHNPYGFLVSTSCNPSGCEPAMNFEQAASYFYDDVGYLLAQNLGFDKPSQIVNLLTDEVLR
ncbi:hypothetical protein B0181_08785 [Moraxella caviae]|nr:hypothetical protein B0181_08785 [Moraxella caviae]